MEDSVIYMSDTGCAIYLPNLSDSRRSRKVSISCVMSVRPSAWHFHRADICEILHLALSLEFVIACLSCSLRSYAMYFLYN